MNNATLKSLAAAVLMLSACNKADFTRTEKTKEPVPVAPPVPAEQVITTMGMDERINGGQRTIRTIDRLDIVFQAADTRVLDENVVVTKQGVDLYFVLDTTASMTKVMTDVKNGVSRLAESLKTSGIDLKVGLVGFVDSYADAERRTFKLSSDIVAFKNFLTNIQPQDNQDYPESSLYASRRAVELLKDTAQGRADALKVIVLISDVLGHNGSDAAGTAPVRDCTVDRLASDINTYAATLPGGPENFRFFYSVPDPLRVAHTEENAGAFVNCQGTDDPNGYTAIKQMADLLTKILPSVAAAKRGGPLLDSTGNMLWPLTQTNLVDTLAPLLRTSTLRSNISGSCLATRAELVEGNKVLHTWTPTQLKDVNDAFRAGRNEIRLPNVTSTDRAQGVRQLDLKIDRCCVIADDLTRNNFGACKKTYSQTIRYEITATQP